MKYLRKAFLYFVGAVSIAYEEANKTVKEQQKKLNKKTNGAVKIKA
jgi:hypothetical protein